MNESDQRRPEAITPESDWDVVIDQFRTWIKEARTRIILTMDLDAMATLEAAGEIIDAVDNQLTDLYFFERDHSPQFRSALASWLETTRNVLESIDPLSSEPQSGRSGEDSSS